MKEQNAKWELEILYTKKQKLKEVGRDLDYNEDQRIKSLQNFLDSLFDEPQIVEEKPTPVYEQGTF